jgi:hypothetical protein
MQVCPGCAADVEEGATTCPSCHSALAIRPYSPLQKEIAIPTEPEPDTQANLLNEVEERLRRINRKRQALPFWADRARTRRFHRTFLITTGLVLGLFVWGALTAERGPSLELVCLAPIVVAPAVGLAVAFVTCAIMDARADIADFWYWITGRRPPDWDEIARRAKDRRRQQPATPSDIAALSDEKITSVQPTPPTEGSPPTNEGPEEAITTPPHHISSDDSPRTDLRADNGSVAGGG